MVQEFNDAFSRVSEDYGSCDGAAVNAEAGFAVAGQRIATRLASHYFPRRASKREGSE
jgi:predicted secreted protein